MRKLRLAFALPFIQSILAAILLQWRTQSGFYVPTPRLVCWGLNAPALLFRTLNPIRWGPAFWWLPRSILGFDTDDLFFMAGVIVLWYLVGHALDRRGVSATAGRRRTASCLLAYLLLLALGGVLLYGGLHLLRHKSSDNPNDPVRAVLVLIWSVGLLCVSGRGFAKAIRRAFLGSV